MPPKVTKRWVPVNRTGGVVPSGGRGAGASAADRTSARSSAPPLQRAVTSKATAGTKRWVPVNRAGGASRWSSSGGGEPDADCLSALPDALLHHILSFLKAWELVRTCVLSRRWRHLWASAPCVDLRVGQDDYDDTPEDFLYFVRQLFRRRDASASLDTLRVRSSNVDGAHGEDHSRNWIRTAIKRGARVIHLVGHRRVHCFVARCAGSGLAALDHTAFVSSHLKVLQLPYAMLDDNMLKQLSTQCPSLEELYLTDCVIAGPNISSASLKKLTMFKCKINMNLSIACPNLVLMRCVSPITQAPSFKDMGSLVTGTIILDDRSFIEDDFEDFSKDELEETTDEDDNDSYCKDKNRYRFGLPLKGYGFGCKDGYGSDIESDDNTYEYSEIANACGGCSSDGYGHISSKDGKRNAFDESSESIDHKVLGGHNILHSLSNATSLELLAGDGEVILNRELKRCPIFNNLKTMSLGEWCMGADFDALVFLLQHSPNLERLFLELELSFSNRKALESGVKPKERSFSCKHLRMVKIKCSKDDARVHKVAHLFKANGVSAEKIFVRRTGSTYLRGEKMMKDLARQELEFWEEDEFWESVEFGLNNELWGDDESSEDDEFWGYG